MRILFTRFPLESRHGGAEVQTMSLMRGLAARGHGIAFLGSCPTLLELCDRAGVLAGELKIGPPPVTKRGAVSFLWRRRTMRRKLLSAVQEFGKLDAIVMLSLTEKLLLTPWARERGMRVLWVEHDLVGRWLTRNPWLPALKKACKGATIVTVSDLSRKIYTDTLRFPPERVATIVNGIDPSRLEGGTAHARPEGSRLHVGTVARLSRDKGVDLLVRAVADLPDVTLDILPTGGSAGDTEFIRSLAEKINESGRRIRIIAPTEDGIGAFYRSLDVFVLPSRESDPCPLAPMEALWLGMPTILTDVCGTAGSLQPAHDALIVPAGSADALRHAITELKDPARRAELGHKGQETARRQFTLERMVEEYASIL